MTEEDTEDKQLSQVEETGEKIWDNPVVLCREKLFMRKDNYLYFITSEGESCDDGAMKLKIRKNSHVLKI